MGVKGTVTFGLPFLAFLMLVGLLAGDSAGPAPATAPRPVRLLAAGASISATWTASHPHAALVLAALVAVPLLLGSLASLLPRSVQKDPQRMFTSAQRQVGFNRAGDRCEMEVIVFLRCRKAAAHGDHWFPWSRGGPTDMDNFVAACVRHNTSKGAKVPTFWQTQRLAMRRRRYFAAHLNPTAGGRFEIPDRRAS